MRRRRIGRATDYWCHTIPQIREGTKWIDFFDYVPDPNIRKEVVMHVSGGYAQVRSVRYFTRPHLGPPGYFKSLQELKRRYGKSQKTKKPKRRRLKRN